MKKLFGEGGIVGFLSRHCEKLIFGLAVLIVVWVALPDGEHAPLDESTKGPDVLKTKASQGSTKLQADSWPKIHEIRFPQKDGYLERSRNDLKRVDVAGYPAEVPLDKPLFPQDKIRRDPTIYPIEKLHIAVDYGAVAMNDPDARAGGARGGALPDEEARPFPPETAEYVNQFGASSVASGAKTDGRFIVAVTGLVPILKQRLEYESVLGETAGFQEQRDTEPNYGAFEGEEEDAYGPDYYRIERAEVLPDGTIGEFQTGWGGRLEKYDRGSRVAKYVQMQWAGGGITGAGVSSGGAQRGMSGRSTLNGDDFPAARYVDSRFAMNVPPLLLRPLPPLANHPDVPRARELAEGASAPEEGSDEPPLGLEDPLAGAAPAPRGEERSRRVPAGARQEGGEGAYDSSSSGEDVEHYLFRFYDTHAEPGKSYVYRVKLLVEDPNYPRDPAMRPPTRTLSPDVIERLKRRPDKSVWWRESPYSEVSPVAHVPDTEKVLAGSVDPGKVARPPQRDFEIRQTEKSAKVMALVWDHEKALDVPGVVESLRGTVVNFTADTEAIDVTANGLRQLPGYRFETQNMVLDIRGGDWFTTKKNYASPGEVLLMDGDGKLVVRSELEDAEIFNNHIFPPPPEEGGGEGILLPEEEEGPRRGRRRSGGEEFDIIGGG